MRFVNRKILNQIVDLRKKPNINKEYWAIFIIIAVAFWLRLYRLGASDIWYDEAYSIIISGRFWQDWNPPLYFGILYYWIKLFGISEFSLRFPSLIFSVSGIYITFLLSKRLFNARIGIFAAIFMSLSAFHIWYAQEARPYSLSMLLGTLSTYFLYKALTKEKNKFWFYYILFSALVLYSDITYFSFFLLFVQLFSVLLFFRNRLSLRIFWFFPILLIFPPRLLYLVSKLRYIKGGFWIPVPNLRSFIITIENFNLGYNSCQFEYLFSNILSCLLLLGCFLLLKRRIEWIKKTIFICFLFFLPIALIFMISKIFVPVYLDRGMIIFSPYYYILLSLGAEYFLLNKGFKKAIIFALIFCFLSGIYSYYKGWMFVPQEHHRGVHLKKAFKPAVRFIEKNFKTGDIVAHTNFSSQFPFVFYSQKKEILQYFLFMPGMIDSNWQRPLQAGGENVNVKDISLADTDRLWVIACDWPRSGGMDDNSIAVKTELDKRYQMELNLNFDGLRIFRYVK